MIVVTSFTGRSQSASKLNVHLCSSHDVIFSFQHICRIEPCGCVTCLTTCLIAVTRFLCVVIDQFYRTFVLRQNPRNTEGSSCSSEIQLGRLKTSCRLSAGTWRQRDEVMTSRVCFRPLCDAHLELWVT